MIFGISTQELFGQLLIGLINGSFYALLSLGLAVIFGLLNIINFTHGAQYMMGAFISWMLLNWLGVGYWWSLLLAPAIVGLVGIVIERIFLSRIYALDHLYGLLLTFGIALVIQGIFRHYYGVSGLPSEVPELLRGGRNLGFMFLPNYRLWVIVASFVICIATWFVIEKTKLGVHLRAATENAPLVGAFGINVPRLITLTYGFGVALAGLAGVFAAPIYSVNANMGSDLIIIAFAVVVIGGMGSIMGAIIAGFSLGVVEGLSKVFYPEASGTVIFVVMVLVLFVRRPVLVPVAEPEGLNPIKSGDARKVHLALFLIMAVLLVFAPFVLYPIFVMKVLCFTLFVAAFAFLLNYAGLLSFGHAAYFGVASYVTAYLAKRWGVPTELSVLSAVAIATCLGAVLGAIAIRRQGIYFAMITLALAQMVYFISLQMPSITGGDDGIQAVPRGYLFGIISLSNDINLYAVVATVFLLCALFIYRVMDSPFGRVCKAIRGNELRALSLGYRANRYKLLVFILSAGLAGLAGSMKTIIFQLASLNDVHWSMSGEIILMGLIGGMATLSGPVVGALVIITMQQYLAHLGAWLSVAQGLIFIACVMTFRSGLVGMAAKYMRLPL